MAYTVINKPASYFNTVIYTGDGTTPRTLTGVGFKPDFSWTKRRDGGQGNTNHNLYNNVVGAGNNSELASNTTGAEGGSDANLYGYLSAFTSDGFTVADGTDATYKNLYTNNSGGTYVAWNWLAANSTATNTSGTITSTVSVNTTSGFSVVTYTGNGNVSATVGHGLGVTPNMIINKGRNDGTWSWRVYHSSLPANNSLYLQATDATASIDIYGGINSVGSTTFGFSGGTSAVNTNGNTYITYCFANVKGYSKFGSYTGNGSANGPFIYTGFKPAFVMSKCSSSTSNWNIYDDMRPAYNQSRNPLSANTSNTETSTGLAFDLVSNGFKWREGGGQGNDSGATYIYMAFAENPFVSATGIPATAR